MNKIRLENFSDGVFAIAVTLLILNVKIPDAKNYDNHELNYALRKAIPHLVTFAFSFIVISVFWVAHHRTFSLVKVVNNPLLWLNILYLLFVAIIPYPAALLAENPFLSTGILAYTVTLLSIALMHFVLLNYIINNKHIKHDALTPVVYRSYLKSAIVGPVCYISAAACSFINPYISFCFIIGALIYYIFFSGRGKFDDRLLIIAKEELSG
jgi:uncharacterized membrane protein